MNFHLEFFPKPLSERISHDQHILLVGSCFTENMGTKLKQHKFSVLENPHGILFNPVSIARSLESYLLNQQYTADDLFYQNESWHSWDHHSRFSHPDRSACLNNINESRQQANDFLKKAGWLMITIGSAFVYQLPQDRVVANCHKVPTDKFDKKLLKVAEINAALQSVLEELMRVNPGIRILFTISPVRHIRDGFVENNRSKATLIQAVHELVESNERCFYFPAYELVIDDLRDYRFYAEDMVHPNYAATNYVWEKFVDTCIDQPAQKLMKEINTINAAKQHKPFNPGSEQHRKFLQTYLEKVKQLSAAYAYIDFEEEEKYFRQA